MRLAMALAIAVASTAVLWLQQRSWRQPESAAGPGAGAGGRQVFVLRHCVRSTTLKIKRAAPGHVHAQAYSAHPLPAWGVDEKMCTAGGLSLIRGSAVDLLRRFEVRLPARIVTDTSERDVQTALAMAEVFGSDAAALEYDAQVFDSLDADDGSEPLCAPEFSDAQLAEEVQQRLVEVPMPGELRQALEKLQALIGVGDAGPLTDMPAPHVSPTGHLSGVVGAFRIFAQNIFYSFASDIEYITPQPPSDIYALIAWQHWHRSVGAVNALKASENAPLLHDLLRALAQPHNPAAAEAAAARPRCGEDADACRDAVRTETSRLSSTFYVGHDGNLDGLAALLKLRWDAPPYWGGKLLPTPPGSGLRFVAKGDDGSGAPSSVAVSFVYPVFINPTTAERNASGVLEEVRLFESSWAEFVARAMRGLDGYIGATRCYHLRANRSKDADDAARL